MSACCRADTACAAAAVTRRRRRKQLFQKLIPRRRTRVVLSLASYSAHRGAMLPLLALLSVRHTYGTEACPVNSAMRHSLQFALNRALFKIFGAPSKDTYKNICKYFGIRPMDEKISARRSKFYLRYCASESAVCHASSKLRQLCSMTLCSQRLFCSV